MKIGRIGETKRGRFSLSDENGEFLFSVDGETLAKYRLKEGGTLSGQELDDVRAASDTRRAKDKALRLISLRDYASGELYDKLCLTFDEQSAAAAVAELRRLELLNDENFALHRAKYLLGQNRSLREVRAKLAEKGIARAQIDAVLEQLSPCEADACAALVEKSYLGRLRAGEREKVLAALARRGFSYGAAKQAIEDACARLDCGDGGAETGEDAGGTGWDE